MVNILAQTPQDCGKVSQAQQQLQALSGEPALKAFLGTLQPKAGSHELWLKYGHDRFAKASWTPDGRIEWQETRLEQKGCSESRTPYGAMFGFEELAEKCRTQDGGAFYIPTQPQGLPLATNVTSTDTLSVEIDQGAFDEQWALYQEFAEVTGLLWSSLLTSGSKSIHGHIKADQHLPLEPAQYLRRLLVLAMQSDPVTVRLHQPMRIPGFHRKEKGAEQTLLSHCQDHYTFEQLLAGLRLWFDAKGLPFPDRFTDAWWLEFHHTLKGCAKLGESARFDKCKALLCAGLEEFESKLAAEAAEREQRAAAAKASRAGSSFVGKSPVEQVADASADLGQSAFNNPVHNWVFGTGYKARGCCPFHQSASGNSAWIAPLKDGDGWGFHCSACTDDKPINAFGYWWYSQKSFGAKYPSGREYIQAAKDFLNHYGFNFEESKRMSDTTDVTEEMAPATLKSQLESAFAAIADAINARTGIVFPASDPGIDRNADVVKAQARLIGINQFKLWRAYERSKCGFTVEWLADKLELNSEEHKAAEKEYLKSIGVIEERRSVADKLIDIIDDAKIDFFQTGDRVIYADVRSGAQLNTWQIVSKDFKNWLRRSYFAAYGTSVAGDAVNQAVDTIGAINDGKCPEGTVSVRAAKQDGAIYLDMRDRDCRAVKITPDGWEVTQDYPVRFRPGSGVALPEPVKGGDLGLLRNLCKFDFDNWVLIVMFLIQWLYPTKGHPIMFITAPPQSGKTTIAEALKKLVDPSSINVRGTVSDPRDFAIQATQRRVILIDNLSFVSEDQSNMLCGVSTGSGFSTRTLHSNDEETVFLLGTSNNCLKKVL
jgi:hypothetical protein